MSMCPKQLKELGEHEVWQASQRCVTAAMKSTVAFDGVPDRSIVTDMHGAAHVSGGGPVGSTVQQQHR